MLNSGRVSVRVLGIGWSYGWTVGPILTRLAGLFLGHWIFPLGKKLCQDLYQVIISQGMKLLSFLARKSAFMSRPHAHPTLSLPPKEKFDALKTPKVLEFSTYRKRTSDLLLEVYRPRPFRIVKEAWQSGVNSESTFVFFLQELTISTIYIYFPREFGQVSKWLCASSVSFLNSESIHLIDQASFLWTSLIWK